MTVPVAATAPTRPGDRPPAAVRAPVHRRRRARARGAASAPTLRDNLAVMGSATRVHFVNPQLRGDRRDPLLAVARRAPGAPGHGRARRQPAAGRAVHPGGGRRRRSRRSSSPAAAWSRAARPPRRCSGRCATSRSATGSRCSGPNCMGMVDWTTNSDQLHRRREPVAAARPRRGARPVGERDRRVHPRAGLADRLQPDRVDRRRGRARPVRLPRVLPRRPRDPRGHAVRRGVQAAGAVPRPRRPGARDGQADPRRQGRAVGAGPGRGVAHSGQPRGRGPGDRRRARGGRRHPLRGPRRAAGAGRADRRLRPARPRPSGAGGPAS